MASPANYSVGYNFEPTDTVFVIDSGTIKSGTIVQVEIRIDSTQTIIKYWTQVENEIVARSFSENDVFSSCRAAPGYQDIVFLNDLEDSPNVVAINPSLSPGSPLGSPVGSPIGTVYKADILVDSSTTVQLSHLVTGGETFASLISEINTQLGALATAALYQNNIRITSNTKSSSSRIDVGGIASPLEENYFKFLNYFTGLAASIDGLDEGAIEELGNRTCTR